MLLSFVTRTSNPRTSASVSSSPFLICFQAFGYGVAEKPAASRGAARCRGTLSSRSTHFVTDGQLWKAAPPPQWRNRPFRWLQWPARAGGRDRHQEFHLATCRRRGCQTKRRPEYEFREIPADLP